MRKSKKKYKRPLKLWNRQRIDSEKEIMKSFGLRKKREIWNAEALLRKFRRMARVLAAKKDKEMEKMLVKKLVGLGMLGEGSNLDDVLSLSLENILERRLQTLVFKKGLANTPNQSRQFIVHGHVVVDGRKVIYPSYIVSKELEEKIKVEVAPVAKKTKIEVKPAEIKEVVNNA